MVASTLKTPAALDNPILQLESSELTPVPRVGHIPKLTMVS